MSDTVIKVENLTKKYIISHKTQERYSTLRDSLAAQAKAWGQRLAHPFKSSERGMITGDEKEEFCALDDVSFEIKRGDRVGIIGRNGAGKSTLLKILSRITEPTSGRIEITGRVASLLEVGTGFHPELTGRENIFLNGAILGMSKVDIKRKFDEIVAFAEVDKFLDTPVKRYSSGMYVRLAFAVAAHLEPEILIVDEVLAVGDAQFQKKCLGKMEAVGNEGRTVLFVSHNMPSIQRLCSKAIFLEKGHLQAVGETENIVSSYLSNAISVSSSADLTCLPKDRRRGNGIARFIGIDLLGSDGRHAYEIKREEPFTIKFQIEVKQLLESVLFGFSFVAQDGTEIMGSTARDCGIEDRLESGTQTYSCEVSPMILNPGRYYIRAAIFKPNEVFDHIDEMIAFDVLDVAHNLSTAPIDHYVGQVYLPFEWCHE